MNSYFFKDHRNTTLLANTLTPELEWLVFFPESVKGPRSRINNQLINNQLREQSLSRYILVNGTLVTNKDSEIITRKEVVFNFQVSTNEKIELSKTVLL